MPQAVQQKAPQQKSILIVDDTPINIGVISGALKDTYKTKVATSGEKALAIANGSDKPDLILLDVMMPEMDGYEVCRRLKANPETRDIPVIFLTGQTGTEDETMGFEVGAVDYIHKPFSEPVVKARVRTHMMLREAHALIAKQLIAMNIEMEMGRQIQMSILPKSTPKLPGIEIVARYMPMTAVAGDFYDFIIVDEKRLGILVADVSGHGLPSALIASMLQVALTAQAGNASDPARVLSGLNQALCGKFEHNFVTAVYVYVDMEKKMLTYAGAGHPPMLFWGKSTGSAREVMENGLFLGMFPEATYASLQVPIAAGDRSILYTDGIPETKNPLEVEFGTGRIKQFMEKNRQLSADQFADGLIDDLSAWAEQPRGQGQQDDITVLTIDFKN
jgi:sigma-B regulation protein RsbU (phosphoserine phosphatase)